MPRLTRTLALTALCMISVAARPAPVPIGDTGTMSGQVTDRRGLGLVGAHVDVTDQTTGQTMATLARSGGHYLVPGIIVGHRYEVLVRCIGFAPSDRSIVASAGPGGVPSVPLNVSLAPLVQEYTSIAR